MLIDREKNGKLFEGIIILTVLLSIPLFNSKAGGLGRTNLQNENGISTAKLRINLSDIPEYGVFDWIEFEKSPNGKVVLKGYAVFTETKEEAEKAAKKTDGVKAVENKIEVLPNSRTDNEIRNQAWEKSEKNSGLENYVEGANPAVHIIVNRGNVSLFGTVRKESDAELFAMVLKGIPGVSSVQNDLKVLREDH
ncbi:MAG: BON domain-containing protein [Pyrinomonadaceae bacterium]